MNVESLPLFILPVWLGILTSISPCPLAANITAISYISKGKDKKTSIFNGLSYALGRVFAYITLTIIIVNFTDKISTIAMFLQNQATTYVAIILMIIGVFMLDIIPLNMGKFQVSSKILDRVSKMKYIGSFLLGILFALSFCPISAGLFFGNITGLVMSKQTSIVGGASLYGLGTAIPVIISAFILTFAKEKIGGFFTNITKFEKFGRIAIAIIFIMAGLYILLFK